MERDPVNPERGAALFLALFALVAVGYVTLRLVTITRSYAGIMQSYRDGVAYLASIRMKLIPPKTTQRSCAIQSVESFLINGTPVPKANFFTCSDEELPFLSNQITAPALGNPNYNAIFKHAIPCPGARSTISQSSFDSPFAGFNCKLPSSVTHKTIVTDNILIDETTIEETPIEEPDATLADSAKEATLLTTPGSLRVEARLNLSGPTLIIAGGDIRIPSLNLITSDRAATKQVTVISAHGDVVIEKINSQIELLVFARRGISVPPAPAQSKLLLPPIRIRSVAGIDQASFS